MKRELAEKIITEYLKPIYGFALKRCATLQDAEDLTQEIVLRVFRALLTKDDIDSVEKFVWTVARNALSNYYRDKSKTVVGIPVDELADILPSGDDVSAGIAEKETIDRLHMEIAYLSRLQRRIIIAYYYENKKQEVIASELQIPLGTVKWHLFEAKKDLKKGVNTMRNPSELKFNPIKFDICGTNGSVGTKGNNSNFFRSALSQNIEYAVWKDAKTVNEIADMLGVSPVYVESEAEYLYEYGFLTKKGDKYLCNILLDEANDDIIRLHDEMYLKAAKLFANELYDTLLTDGILDSDHIICEQNDKPLYFDETEKADENFILWSLIPYIAALSGESLMDKSISFEDACTIRPDGGQNICYASIVYTNVKPPMYFDSVKKWSGPCWNANADFTLWQIDSEWSARRVGDNYSTEAERILSLLSHEQNNLLTPEEYAYLSEKGFIKTLGNINGNFKTFIQVVWISDIDTKNKLIAIGDHIKEKHWAEFEALKAPFVKAILADTPKQLQKMQKYGLQYIFFSDGWFVLHCLKELIGNGRLKLPTAEQKKSLTTIIVPNR